MNSPRKSNLMPAGKIQLSKNRNSLDMLVDAARAGERAQIPLGKYIIAAKGDVVELVATNFLVYLPSGKPSRGNVLLKKADVYYAMPVVAFLAVDKDGNRKYKKL